MRVAGIGNKLNGKVVNLIHFFFSTFHNLIITHEQTFVKQMFKFSCLILLCFYNRVWYNIYDVDCCRNIVVKNCNFETGDDLVVVKATKSILSHNVFVQNCKIKS